jgi:hypothetical protein
MNLNENQHITIDGHNVAPGDWFACIDDTPETSALYYLGNDGRQYASYLSEAVFVGKP